MSECTFPGYEKNRDSQLIRLLVPDSSLGAFWIAIDAKFLHADNEDSNQTALSLRWVRISQGASVLTLRFVWVWKNRDSESTNPIFRIRLVETRFFESDSLIRICNKS